MMKPIIACLLCTLSALVLAGLPGRAVGDSYSPEVLFTLAYGESLEQIGVVIPEPGEGPAEGPGSIAVGPDGSVYIADNMNRRLKRFDQQGQLLMATEPNVENLHYLTVDGRGNAYGLVGGGLGTLAKFSPEGEELWRMGVTAAIPEEIRRSYRGLLHGVFVGPEDTICVQITSEPRSLAVFTGDGEFVELVPGDACTPTGRIFALGSVPGQEFSRDVAVFDFAGREIASYRANSLAADPAMFTGVPHGLTWFMFDSDHLYTIALAKREHTIQLRGRRLHIYLDTVITRHDNAGNVAAYLRLPAAPFPYGRHETVDQQGNIYQLLYGENSVDVVKYLANTRVADISSLHALPSLSRGGARYIPLRMIAKYCNMDLKWNPDAKQVTLSSDIGGDNPRQVRLAAGDQGVILHYGRLWISMGAAHDKLGPVFKTDANQQIAYVERLSPKRVARLPR